LTNNIENVKDIMLCIARLHNFCIDERLKTTQSRNRNYEITARLNNTQLAYMHAAANAEHEEIISEEYPQWSRERERMVKLVKDKKLKRPSRSVLQKRKKRLH
jgi:hypothetical protein